MPPPMVLANAGGRANGNDGSLFGDVRNLADFTLAEENVDERFRLFGKEALDKVFLLGLAALCKWHFCGGFHGVNGGSRGEQTALFPSSRFARGGKDQGVVHCISEFFIAFARPGSRFIRDLACKCNRSGEKITFDDAVDDAEFQRFFGFDRIAAHTHLNGFGDPREPRKALRPRRARNEAKLYFRLADLCGGKSNAIVAGHSQFQPPAKSRSVNGYNHRLAAVFDFQKQRKKPRAARLARHHLAEFFNVRTGDKGTAAADQDHGFDALVLSNLIQRF